MKAKFLLFTLAAACASVLSAKAAIQGQAVEYKAGDTACEGYVAFDDAATSSRPGILVVHNWMGLSDHTRSICQELAKLGYTAFAADIYGKGVRPANPKEAGA